MPIDFFRKEFNKVQTRFNEVYGGKLVFDRQVKCSVIFSITRLGILIPQIKKTHRKEDIKEFVRRKDSINNFLNHAEEQFQKQERRHHGNRYVDKRRDADAGGHVP